MTPKQKSEAKKAEPSPIRCVDVEDSLCEPRVIMSELYDDNEGTGKQVLRPLDDEEPYSPDPIRSTPQ